MPASSATQHGRGPVAPGPPRLGSGAMTTTAALLMAGGLVDLLQPVCAAGEEARVAGLLEGLPALPPVAGGATRQESVRAGLEALAARADPPSFVLVHDAARPVVPRGTVPRLLAALDRGAPGAIPGQPVAD